MANNEKLLDLGKTLGANVVAGWDSGTPDPGVAFLQGATTKVSSTVQNAMGAVSGTMNNAADALNLYNAGNQLIQTASQLDYKEYAKVIKDAAMKILKEEISDYAKEKYRQLSTEITTASTTFLAQRTAYWTGVNTKVSVSELLAGMLSPVDKMLENQAKSSTNNALKEQLSNIKEKASAVMGVVDSAMSAAETGISSALTYMDKGPKFVETTLNKYINLAITPIKKQIDQQVESIIDEAYKTSEDAANKLGSLAGMKATSAAKSAAEKQKANIEKAKVTVVQFAKGALDLVKKKALALIGV